MICGVYRILNLINGKCYIGSSVNVVNFRWNKHKRELRNNEHHSIYLQNAWNKYGEDSFQFEIIEECNSLKEELLAKEQYWLDFYRSYESKFGYNICRTAGSNLGRKFSEEIKRKMSDSQRGKSLTEETKRKISNSHKGIICREEVRERISEKLKGEKNPMFGKCHSEETKQKISISMKGKLAGNKNPMYGVERRGENGTFYGKHHTEDSKRKMSENKKGKFVGENHPRARLVWGKVLEIREKYITGYYTQKQLSEEYNISESTIYRVVNNINWIVR